MKLIRSKSSSSFYESFTDLIFATMAIFVLLLIIFISQVRPVESTSHLEQQLAEMQDQLAGLQDQLAQSQSDAEQSRKSLVKAQEELASALKKHPIELVVAIDVSASMSVPLNRLKDAIIRLTTEIPKVTEEFRVGVVAYGGNGQYWTIPLTAINPSSRPGFIARVNNLNLVQGSTDVPEAIGEAMNMFTPPSDEKVRKAFVLIGDVGPYEIHGSVERNLYNYNEYTLERMARSRQETQVDKSYEAGLYEKVANFSRANPMSSVMAMYSGNATRAGDVSYSIIALTRSSSINFFRNVAAAGNQNGKTGHYSEDPSEMLSMLLLAMLSTR